MLNNDLMLIIYLLVRYRIFTLDHTLRPHDEVFHINVYVSDLRLHRNDIQGLISGLMLFSFNYRILLEIESSKAKRLQREEYSKDHFRYLMYQSMSTQI